MSESNNGTAAWAPPQEVKILFEEGMFIGVFELDEHAQSMMRGRAEHFRKAGKKVDHKLETYIRLEAGADEEDGSEPRFKSQVKRVEEQLKDEPRTKLIERLVNAQQDLADLEHTFNLIHSAHLRAIAAWRAENPKERELKWPDGADLTKWLIEKLAVARSIVSEMPDANTTGNAGWQLFGERLRAALEGM